MPKRTKVEAAKAKFEAAKVLSEVGSSVAGPIGGTLGGAAGLILGDEKTVFPVDVVCIPAFQAYLIQGQPSMMYYFRAGETVLPTGGNVEDVQQVVDAVAMEPSIDAPKKKRRKTKYQRAYGKHFDRLASTYKLKNGKWKKGGFKKCVSAAHAATKKEMK